MKKIYSQLLLSLLLICLGNLKAYSSIASDLSDITCSNPVLFTIQSNKDTILVGKDISLTLRIELNEDVETLFYKYNLKVILPAGFVQTGGNYTGTCIDKVDLKHPSKIYTIKGHFIAVPIIPVFSLLGNIENTEGIKNDVEENTKTINVIPLEGGDKPHDLEVFSTKSAKILALNMVINSIKVNGVRVTSTVNLPCGEAVFDIDYTYINGASTSYNVIPFIHMGGVSNGTTGTTDFGCGRTAAEVKSYIDSNGVPAINLGTLIPNQQVNGTLTFKLSTIVNSLNIKSLTMYHFDQLSTTTSTSTSYNLGCSIGGSFPTILLPNLSPVAPSSMAASPASINLNGTSKLSATCSNSTLRWYSDSLLTSALTGISPIVSPISTTTYYAICDNGTCKSSDSRIQVSVTNPPPISITTQPLSATICQGRNATLFIQATNVTTYQWRKNGVNIQGETSSSLNIYNSTSINAGSYDVILSNSIETITTVTAVLTISTGPSLSFSTNNVSCYGAANGSATVIPTSNGSYSYSWTNGGTSATINNLTPNTYTVTVTDGNGCTKSGSVSITQPTALGLSISNTAVSCKNGSTGIVTANPSGGTSPYSYAWSNGATTQTVNNLTAGMYNVTITDANGCTKTGSATVTEPTELMLTSSSVPVKCKGESNGSASVVASGGTAPYTYSWDKGARTSTLSNVSAGNYTVTVTDGNGCTKSTTVTVIEAATLLTITGTPTTAIKCNGGNDGVASVNVTGGAGNYSYTWTTKASTQTISNLSVGEYGISVLDAYGCVRNASVIITQSTLLMLSTSSVAVKCKNGNDGSATINVNGGISPYTYVWNTGATTASISNLVAGTYNVTVTDANNCSKTTSVVVTEPALVVLSMSSVAVKCKNGNDGSATVNVTGGTAGYSYLWSTGLITPTINNLVTGTYSVTVTDANNCAKNSTITVTEPTELMISGSSVAVKCKNGNDGNATITATGGTAPYSYLWDKGATRTSTLSNVSAGTYKVTVTDANNCVKNINVVVTEPTALSISTSNVAVKCKSGNDGSVTVTATGGTTPYTYLWSNGATTSTATNLTVGTYNIRVTDANGCLQTASVIISEPTELIVTGNSVAVKCKNGNDGSATINVNGGISPYTYVWNTGATTASISNLVAGTYNVTVTDANNCVKSITIVVIEPTELMISTSSIAVKCKNGKDGSVTVVPTGGTAPYTYRWSNSATTQTATGLIAGMYSVTVTDVNNCAKNSSVAVTEPTALTYQFTKEEVKCNAGSDGKIAVIAQGGTSPYKFIYNGTAASTDLTVITLKAGDYLINVQDNNNCLANEQKTTLTQPPAIEVNITEELMPRGFQTKDGQLVAKIVGGTAKQNSLYTTAWLFEGITTILDKQTVIAGGTSSTIDKIQGGNYALTITDDNFALSKTNEGCKKVFTYFMKQPDKIVSVATVDKSVSCFGKSDGKLTTTVKGGVTFKTGATYLYKWFKQDQAGWINLNLSTATIQYVDAGQYMVKIEDANGITDSVQVNLKVTPSINSKVVSQINPSCSSSKDGLIEVQAIGAVEPITVTWSKALTGTKITNLAQGNYFGIIKDNAGCFGEVTVTLTAKENVSAELISKKELVCADKCEAVLELAVKGAISPYTVQWSNGATGLKNSQLCAGTYGATVKTTNGCSVNVDNIKLDTPQAFKIEVSNDIDICSESTLEINAASQVAQGVSYVWTYPNGAKSTNPIASIKTAGAYKIEVVNANGCSASDDFKVNVINIVTGINFTITSQGQVGESIYAVNLSPTSLATTWNVIGSADILQNDKSILKIKPITEGTLKVELTATVGTCKANLVKSITISKASTVVKKSIPKVELESIDDLILVYPNPNEGHFVIKADPSIEGKIQIKIYDGSLSEVLYTETFDTATKSQVEVTIPEVLNKLLYVVIQSQNKKTVKRVLIRQ